MSCLFIIFDLGGKIMNYKSIKNKLNSISKTLDGLYYIYNYNWGSKSLSIYTKQIYPIHKHSKIQYVF